ncbi:hypothetical protein G6O67_006756 [Ophiocordyceps sinensis]|uniref:cAMP-dependent protein kinase n=2 Tax=Ophiocordyceps sinensis TaxID=72228 RepID=A0A8H4LWW2_9HYPO|nr:cAMP-Ser/Thr protein kinase PKA1 [Ophiocordyceps sinensis CO18]KAF4506701.1 hypothetical protein G6O67_006756 [Ophiocordyceps sinensis]
MPSLGGFLKKKRTRDNNPDPSTANPTSPVTATTPSKPFLGGSNPPPSQPTPSAPAQPAGPTSTQPQEPSAGQQPPPPQQQQQMNNTATARQSAPYATAPNLPSISNLIHHDAANHHHHHNNNNHLHPSPNAMVAPPINKPVSASPGSDAARMLLLQQQAFPMPPGHDAGRQQQAGPQQQQPQQQYHNQPHNQHQSSQGSTPRVTKGKYSLVDFDIMRTLGTGSFGRVHLVQSKHNNRFYAVKVLKKAQVVKMKQVEHTNDERRMLADVKHPFIITLWGTFADCKNLYMVMDFVEGGELFSLLRKSGRFPNPVAKFYAAETTLALEYLHSKNIIYRDLKPENLLLDRHGHLKITDFGFAKRVPDKTWTLCGTPDYLAPEVVSNKGYNKSVDWWSLGILIYEMLCGYTPFWDSGSPMRIYENILKGKIKYPAYVNADAQNLLGGLITADLTKRLGNLYGGPQDIKNHAWFAEVTWDRLAHKDIDAPYTPPVKAGAGDSSQFDKYPEDPDKYGGPADAADEFGHLFTEF